MHGRGIISIWFFIGVILLAYGVIITGVSIYYVYTPPPVRTVLGETHPGIWWGLLMLVLGLVYTIKFRPKPDTGA